MKLQNMTVIFSIIVIPITLILSAYIGVQIDTVMMVQKYDTALMSATHDAISAFELNTINNKYSTNADSIRRDIKAAVNTFSTSLATKFGRAGSESSSIMSYIPALVFTLYDGYYIYSPHEYNYEYNGESKTGYEHILEPYIQYTGRYKTANNDNDIVVNYSLDNYVTIYGYIGSEYISYSGYLIDTSKLVVNGDGIVTHYKLSGGDNLDITQKETLTWNEADGNNNYSIAQKSTDSVQRYYQEAYDFTKWVNSNTSLISTVTPANAVRSDGSKYDEFKNDNTEILDIKSSNDPEDRASAFTQHKREIMKISIQDNLNKAIKVYNDHSPSMGTHANFRMPILTEDDWEKILTNVNMISFMEGIPVGTKIYNNYSIVTSTQNKQYINPNSIYFVDHTTNTYHRINCPELLKSIQNGNNVVGYKSLDFRRLQNPKDNTKYYYKHSELACYTCIVNSLNEDEEIENLSPTLLKIYYRALARERYDLDKVIKYNKTDNE